MKALTRLLLALMILFGAGPTLAQSESDITCETDLIVQADDWLSKIADKSYGDLLAYPAIVEATNAKAATDASYATISNPDLIEIGWKLCLPSQSDALAMLAGAAPAAAGDDAAMTEAPAESDTTETDGAMAANAIDLIFLQMNDVYEITPVSGGTEGGLARVATLRKQLLAENPNTYTVLAGDLFSPSALGTARVDGERLAGQQAVAVMNTLGLDFMTFGNHEFDVNAEQFNQRLSELDFTMFSSNVFDANGQSFANVPENVIFTVTDAAGEEITVGMFGVTLGSNPKDYVSYTDPFEAAAAQVSQLNEQVDLLIALTHLAVDDDVALAQQHPEIDLILGGHEHENMRVESGPDSAVVYKADANARTAYIHRISYNAETDEAQIDSTLQPITPELADDPETLAVVNEWLDKGFQGFRDSGFNPEQLVTQVNVPLDGLESSVRNNPTTLTEIIAQGMLAAAPGSELAMYNGGSIRIDDTIPPGPVTEYDVIRILPFGGEVMSVTMEGSLLKQVLDQGQANAGTGGYLQTAGVSGDSATGWQINGEPLDESRSYSVAINDFLLTGLETGLDYLTEENPGLQVGEANGDVRMTTIAALKERFPPN